MTIDIYAPAPTGDKLADVEEFAKALLAVTTTDGTLFDEAAGDAARSIGAELIRILKCKPRQGIVLGPR